MFDFRKIQLEDRQRVNERLAVSDLRGCEYCFANNLAWQRLNDSLICFHDEFYICSDMVGGKPMCYFPSGVSTADDTGREKYIRLFAELEKYCSDLNEPFSLLGVTPKDLDWMKLYYGDRISVEYQRDNCDYIYNTTDLCEFAGKRYHGKRNHMRRFMENVWSFEPINESNFDECILFSVSFYNDRGHTDGSAAVEQYAINVFFMNMEELGLKGALLRSEGELVGFSIGEQLNSDTFVVHVEKARADVQGAYPMLCSMFARTYATEFRYINREDDMGIEGLRKSKLSYYPAFMVDKYKVNFL